jgi:hypothetical protein
MKVTSQTRSPTCRHADALTSENITDIYLAAAEATPAAASPEID